ncbi:MAG TPA: hypothetical protein VNS09_03110 [Solirubrobacter sp.]|nr:hypothetical protein [Solirubrobacter sp.]
MKAKRQRPSDLLAVFIKAGLAYLIAAAVVAAIHTLAGWEPGHWIALHLAFVGGVSQLVLGAGQFFAGAFLATDPPSRALVRTQLGTWNAGAVLVAVGVPTDVAPLTIAGAVALVAGLVAFLAGLRSLRRRSLQSVPWAVRWYEACAAFLGVGVLAGVLMATSVRWPWGNLLDAHVALNVGGWFGTAIVGTLHTFFPSLTQTQLRHPRLQRPTFACWTLGVAALAAGAAFGADPLRTAGWAALLVAAALLCANLTASLLAAPRPLSLPARLIAVAQAFLVPGLYLASTGAPRAATAAVLLAGWLGLTVLGSLLHLLALLARVRDFRRPLPRPRPARDVTLVAAVSVGVVGLALGVGPAAVLLVAAYAALAGLALSRAVPRRRRA